MIINIQVNFAYNLGYNFGHDNSTLSEMQVILNLLAFSLHAICDKLYELWKWARKVARARNMKLSTIAVITRHMLFADWRALLMEIAGEYQP